MEIQHVSISYFRPALSIFIKQEIAKIYNLWLAEIGVICNLDFPKKLHNIGLFTFYRNRPE